MCITDFKVMAVFAKRFDFAYWWTCIGKGLLAAMEAGFFFRGIPNSNFSKKKLKKFFIKNTCNFWVQHIEHNSLKFLFDLLSQTWPKIRKVFFTWFLASQNGHLALVLKIDPDCSCKPHLCNRLSLYKTSNIFLVLSLTKHLLHNYCGFLFKSGYKILTFFIWPSLAPNIWTKL